MCDNVETEISVDAAGSTITPRACSHCEPVVGRILPDELIHERDIDPPSEVSSVLVQSVLVHRKLMSELLSLLPSS